jgi:hypothetical protein
MKLRVDHRGDATVYEQGGIDTNERCSRIRMKAAHKSGRSVPHRFQ